MILRNREVTLGISINARTRAMAADYAKAGFECAELTLSAQDERDVRERLEYGRETREMIQGHLPIRSVHLPFGRMWDISFSCEEAREGVVRDLLPIVDAAAEWGAKALVIHGSSEPIDPADRSGKLAAAARSLAQLSRYAGALGMRVALEDLPRTCLGNRASDVAAMTGEGRVCGVCFDVNHLLEESHADFLARAKSWVITTHLSDYDGIDERHWLPGMGIVPWKLVFDELESVGYRGPYLFELGGNAKGEPYDPAEIVRAFRSVLET